MQPVLTLQNWTSSVGEHVLTLQFRATILDLQPKNDNFSEYIFAFTGRKQKQTGEQQSTEVTSWNLNRWRMQTLWHEL